MKYMKSWTRGDLFIFFILIPSILLLIFFLPQDLRENYFILHVRKPSATGVFLAHYTHSEAIHLLENIVGYYLVILLLFIIETNRKFFHRMMIFLFLLLPFLLSLANLAVFKDGQIQGFSGIAAGLYGYFLFSAYLNLKNHQRIGGMNMNFPMFLFSLNVSIVMIRLSNVLLSIPILACTLLNGYYSREGLRNLLIWLSSRKKKLVSIFVFLFSCLAAFKLPCLIPRQVIVDGKVINILAHFLGYVSGLFLPVGVSLARRHSKKST